MPDVCTAHAHAQTGGTSSVLYCCVSRDHESEVARVKRWTLYNPQVADNWRLCDRRRLLVNRQCLEDKGSGMKSQEGKYTGKAARKG